MKNVSTKLTMPTMRSQSSRSGPCHTGAAAVLGTRLTERGRLPTSKSYGPPLWAELHRRALTTNPGADDSAWLEQFARRLPCGECRQHWHDMVRRAPPVWAGYFRWTVDRHNEVNVRLGKPLLTLEQARALWSASGPEPVERVL